MKKKIQKDELQLFQEFAAKHPGLLLIAANPGTDEIVTMFQNHATFVKFPATTRPEDRIVLRTLYDSIHFRDYANQFVVGMIKAVGADEIQANQFHNAIAGSVQSINEAVAV
jgi:hypothetical protein